MNDSTLALRFEAFDQLATMVAIASPQGECLLANSTLENVLGVARRTLQRGSVFDWFSEPAQLQDSLLMVARNEVASGRFDAALKRPSALGSCAGELPVHVIVSQTEHSDQVLLEMIEVEQQARLDREERAHGLALANKELLRNLAHEIKNPLGGIRGAAQLLEMDLATRELREYTQVIIHEADRLQLLVDRLLAPHRRLPVVGDVNIHEICERVRSLLLAEHPRGLKVERDYDTSIPEFRGDREQLIQAVLNITHNATQALAGEGAGEGAGEDAGDDTPGDAHGSANGTADGSTGGAADGAAGAAHASRIARGDAVLVLRTRVARQVTIGRQRFRLALELHIQDNGPGVPENIKERIFQPLVSGRDNGTGLGLTLALTFVQQHQGTIEFDSVPGRTVFKLLLPLP